MKWPWDKAMAPTEKHRQLLEEVRQERGKMAETAFNLETATHDLGKAFGLDDVTRRALAELHKGPR